MNSLLILSDQLSANREGNLIAKQVEFAKTIHASGNDLLTLINDILDLSKIESGTVNVDAGELRFEDLRNYVERTFRHVAESRSLDFHIRLDPRLPRSMVTDAKRLQQILKNLLSNAFKFTHQGHVTLTIEPVNSGWSYENADLSRAAEVIAFMVTDTGIGISAEKQHIIFEAFQQADGSTSRKYGGTGLGLAISRELARLLAGEISLVSDMGKGSSFALYLPVSYTAVRASRRAAVQLDGDAPMSPPSPKPAELNGPAPHDDETVLREMAESALKQNEAADDRDNLQPGDTVILIVENDLPFARMLLERVRDRGCKGLVTSQGAGALALARDHMPNAITLDIVLPDMEGWRVIDRLKHDLATRHVPICVISTEDARERAHETGAISFIAKPIQSNADLDNAVQQLLETVMRPMRRVIVAAERTAACWDVLRGVAQDAVELLPAASADAALGALRSGPADLFVADASLGIDLADIEHVLRQTEAHGRLPVVLWGDGAPAGNAETLAHDLLTVRQAHSAEHLADLALFFLHQRVSALPDEQRKRVEAYHTAGEVLGGRRVLIVDDDVRNIYALAAVLEDQNMRVTSAANGRDALRMMSEQPDIDIVLMDIMMPEMDGIATMREARKIPSLHNVPIIAVTAKAMKGDRERCIEAGAWDYLSKPVDTYHLLTVLRSWLHR